MDHIKGKTTLVIAHPGHELRVFGWMEMTRPSVFVFTDGSGHTGHSRLASTTKVLEKVGATKASFYGRLSDRAAYEAILKRDFDIFIGLALEIAKHLIEQEIDYVAGDALEGYNPTHDVCRLVIDTAVSACYRRSDRIIRNYDFPLIGSPTSCDEMLVNEAIKLQLDDVIFERKMAAVQDYSELASEVERTMREIGRSAFRHEWLRPVKNFERRTLFTKAPPFYEQYGERQVTSGYYQEVIRYADHLLPLADALKREAESAL